MPHYILNAGRDSIAPTNCKPDKYSWNLSHLKGEVQCAITWESLPEKQWLLLLAKLNYPRIPSDGCKAICKHWSKLHRTALNGLARRHRYNLWSTIQAETRLRSSVLRKTQFKAIRKMKSKPHFSACMRPSLSVALSSCACGWGFPTSMAVPFLDCISDGLRLQGRRKKEAFAFSACQDCLSGSAPGLKQLTTTHRAQRLFVNPGVVCMKPHRNLLEQSRKLNSCRVEKSLGQYVTRGGGNYTWRRKLIWKNLQNWQNVKKMYNCEFKNH